MCYDMKTHCISRGSYRLRLRGSVIFSSRSSQKHRIEILDWLLLCLETYGRRESREASSSTFNIQYHSHQHTWSPGTILARQHHPVFATCRAKVTTPTPTRASAAGSRVP